MSRPGALQDTHNRIIGDLRISITDRCNFKCVYCLPETEEAAKRFLPASTETAEPVSQTVKKPLYPWKPRSQILNYEEIIQIVRVASQLGVNKIRITGGEPLLRQNVDWLIAQIASIRTIRDLSLTTNGTNFKRLAKRLKLSGLDRVTISLDSLDRANFKKITGYDGLANVLESIRLAKSLDLSPVKINAVIIRGLNDQEIPQLAQFAIDEQIIMRFIEFMPLDSQHVWRRSHVVSAAEIEKLLHSLYHLTPLPSNHLSETSTRWSLGQGKAEIGIIAPVTQPFCGNCNRIRLTADGKIRTCLFSHNEHDLKSILRHNSYSNETLTDRLKQIVLRKEKGHRINQPDYVQPERTMSLIGG